MQNPKICSSPPERILIVSGSEKSSDSISALIEPFRFEKITTAKNSSEARRIMSTFDFDIILINTPLSDEFGHELAIDITQKANSAGVIMIVKNELVDELSEKLNKYGVFLLGKPISRQMFSQTIYLTIAMLAKMYIVKNETEMLRTKIDEIKIIDRAKLILMQYIKMSEKQAHRYIEKQAMDLRLTKREAAENILKTYEQ
ncbi:MAG: hypothetical protein A2Y17_10015 [Clostridiales bacterium GWF2_38_85]|nr:MAG: hypothetical protein A2Y17_10015 [Clostridiales bacterium GWF2_38_85]HBL84452.1 response regulator receiver protein [Clostridiales bacterium]